MKDIRDYFEESFTLNDGYIKDILLDADVLVALAKVDDTNHKKAIQLSNTLQQKGTTFFVSPFTIAEAATVLSHKISQEAAKKFLKQIRGLNLSLLELPQKEQHLADEWFLKQTKKGTSYFDCYNMALMERYKKQLEAIFSFDSIYKKNGLTTVENMKL